MNPVVPARYWHALSDGRLQCDVCPRACRLHDGQRGLCFVRAREGDGLVLTTYGRSSGYCVDPIEKKPLNHFLPGTPVLSFGTAGCNLACRFCQNWDISKSREVDTLADSAPPETIARAARALGCKSVAFTYNDPVIFLEYAIDTAVACRAQGVRTVAVTAGYVCPEARREFFAHMDAANVDLKAFSERFYERVCSGSLAPVLDTLVYLKHET
jgi:pyruvate formate lyase activating enzyme